MKKTFTIFILVLGFTIQFSPSNAQTYFSDNFETGLSRWIVGGNNWDTLSTTYTSSNHCVTDSRVGNYTYNSDPAMTMSLPLNLSSTSVPVLSFFHRFDLVDHCGYPNYTQDNIYLEVSTNAGFNWSLLKSWAGKNRAWTHEQFNLSSYKTNLVKVRFRLSSHNSCSANADGWYIDDVTIKENSTLNPVFNFPFSDNFENGMSKWFAGGFNWDTSSNTPSSGLRSAAESKAGNYTYRSEPTLTMSGVLNLANTTSPVLSFYHRFDLVDYCGYPDYTQDNIYLEVSTNGGFNWTQVKSWAGKNRAWTHAQFNLTNYRTNSVKVRFRLSSHNSCSGSADGWSIDNVAIQENNALNPTFSFPFSDDFETGMSKWFTGGFNWDTSSITPSSGLSSAADSKSGNYTYRSEPTITMSGVLNLTNTTFPVLSFYHRYDLVNHCGYPNYTQDNMYLEVSTNGGFNWSQLKGWAGKNRAWTHEQFNLSSYKTNLVKVRFRLSSHNSCSGSADGWSIDDVSIQENSILNPTFSLPFYDNFENGMSNWFAGGYNWDTTSINPCLGLFSVTDSRTGNYTHNSDPTITMAGVINLTNTGLPVLTFIHRYALVYHCGYPDYIQDNIFLEISTNGGFNWSQIYPWQNNNNACTYEQFDLSNYKTNAVKIRYRLSSHNSCGAAADGAYLDNVSITDLLPSAINLNLKVIMEGLYYQDFDKMEKEDTVRVYLRDASSPYLLVDSAQGIIDSLSFSGLFSFNDAPSGTYYLVVKHFNSIETWSRSGGKPLVRDGSTYYYDFTDSASKAFGNNMAQVDASPVRFGIYSGDVNQEGFVDGADALLVDNDILNFVTGYIATDVNGDEIVDGSDLLIVDNNSSRYVTVMSP